ncbi:hypothetical protein JVU11DRAFT_875 [Chiua virens]|nr:hypothetical protein JVU11DRAFT_875 [Chiua virens]
MSVSDLMTKLRRVLPRATRKWSTNAVEELKKMAREGLDLSPRSKPSTLLPVIFRCRTCRQRLRFKEALSHKYLYKVKPKSRSTRRIPPYESLLRGYSTYPRNDQVLRVDVIASRRVENLVGQLGQNLLASRVTYDEMIQSTTGIKVVCNLCHPKVATSMDFKDAPSGKERNEVLDS